jgi:hypothetical protein
MKRKRITNETASGAEMFERLMHNNALDRVYEDAHKAVIEGRDAAKMGRIGAYPTTIDWAKHSNGRLA